MGKIYRFPLATISYLKMAAKVVVYVLWVVGVGFACYSKFDLVDFKVGAIAVSL